MEKFDLQMSKFRHQLEYKVKIPSDRVDSLFSTIALEIQNNKEIFKQIFLNAKPIPFESRFEELHGFELLMKTSASKKLSPEVTRSVIITQFYICFVYLKENLFEALYKYSLSDSMTKKCAKFLIKSEIRYFRNALAHGNWKYNEDFSGIDFWASKGISNKDSELSKFYVSQSEMNFWQALSRALSYTVYLKLNEQKF